MIDIGLFLSERTSEEKKYKVQKVSLPEAIGGFRSFLGMKSSHVHHQWHLNSSTTNCKNELRPWFSLFVPWQSENARISGK